MHLRKKTSSLEPCGTITAGEKKTSLAQTPCKNNFKPSHLKTLNRTKLFSVSSFYVEQDSNYTRTVHFLSSSSVHTDSAFSFRLLFRWLKFNLLQMLKNTQNMKEKKHQRKLAFITASHTYVHSGPISLSRFL